MPRPDDTKLQRFEACELDRRQPTQWHELDRLIGNLHKLCRAATEARKHAKKLGDIELADHLHMIQRDMRRQIDAATIARLMSRGDV